MKKNIVYIAVVFLLSAHFFTGLDTINKSSATFDETIHITAGYSYLKTGQYYINIYDHPPVAEMYAALPVYFFMKPALLTNHPYWQNYMQYAFANIFLYYNNIDAERMLNAGRTMILLLSCLLGFVVFLWSRKLFGDASGLFALFLYVFSSNILANATVVTTDFATSCFGFISVFLLWSWLDNRKNITLVLMSASTALTLTTKFSGVLILGIFCLVLLQPEVIKKLKTNRSSFFSKLVVACLLIFLIILVVYRFKYINLYFSALYNFFTRAQSGHSTFLMGKYSVTGWPYYFIVAFLIKTPVSLLLMIAAALVVYFRNRIIFKADNLVLLIPMLVFFAVASLSKKQIGIRYILPAYPFLFVWVSGILNVSSKRVQKIFYSAILLVLCGWYAVSFALVHPWHLTYFNEITGGPGEGYKYLTDSNNDWGQGLKQLGKWYRGKNLKGIYLCYFGTGAPHYYGIKYVPVAMTQATNCLPPEEQPGDRIEFKKGDAIYFAVSVTNLQATYYQDREIFSWLKQEKPEYIAANSIFVYNLSGNNVLLQKLAGLLLMSGNKEQANLAASLVEKKTQN